MAKDTSNKFDDVLVPMLAKTAKVVVISFGAILIAHSLTFDIGSILAGLGIGGVAVALAAKDTHFKSIRISYRHHRSTISYG